MFSSEIRIDWYATWRFPVRWWSWPNDLRPNVQNTLAKSNDNAFEAPRGQGHDASTYNLTMSCRLWDKSYYKVTFFRIKRQFSEFSPFRNWSVDLLSNLKTSSGKNVNPCRAATILGAEHPGPRRGCLNMPCLTRLLGHIATRDKLLSKERQKWLRNCFGIFRWGHQRPSKVKFCLFNIFHLIGE